jgi:hypothetical protein
MKRQSFSIPSLAFFEAIIAPAFADQAVDAVGFNGTLREFTLMSNVVSSRPIIDIRRTQNIMQRRDASCDIVYKNLFGATIRKITTTEIYGAVKFCRNEFYQGCLKEFRANDPLFGKRILPYFRSAINIDLTTNAYFGDINRTTTGAEAYSTDLFDGIFKWIKLYTASSVIPAGQTIAIANGTDFTSTPSAAFNIIKGLYDKRPLLMKTFTNAEHAFYVSPEILEGYEDYLISTGSGNTAYIDDIATGRKVPTYKGIVILAEPLWTPVITELKGAAGYAAILTIRNNFIFATDSTYGEDDGSGKDKALIIWFDQEHFTWKYMMFMKAGTGIGLPEFIVYALSSWT